MKFKTENWRFQDKSLREYLSQWQEGDPEDDRNKGELESMREHAYASSSKIYRLLEVLAKKQIISAAELVQIVEGHEVKEPISFIP